MISKPFRSREWFTDSAGQLPAFKAGTQKQRHFADGFRQILDAHEASEDLIGSKSAKIRRASASDGAGARSSPGTLVGRTSARRSLKAGLWRSQFELHVAHAMVALGENVRAAAYRFQRGQTEAVASFPATLGWKFAAARLHRKTETVVRGCFPQDSGLPFN